MSTVQVSIEVNEFRSRLNELDLSPIMIKLMDQEEGQGWTQEKAVEIAAGYKVFLLLSNMYPNKSIVPTKDIDAFWHYHILDTQLYHEHCMYLFGHMLHHFPYFGIRGPEDRANLESAFKETKALFAQHGALVPEYYAHCGNSCQSSLCDNTACDSSDCKPSSRDSQDLTPEFLSETQAKISELMSVRPRLESLVLQ